MQTTEVTADHSEFFRNNYGSLVGYVRNLICDGADIAGEDIVQDVMVNLYNKADITQPIQNFTAYVYSALRNRIVDILRSRKKNVSLDAEASPEHQISLAEFLHDEKSDILATMEKKRTSPRAIRGNQPIKRPGKGHCRGNGIRWPVIQRAFRGMGSTDRNITREKIPRA